MRFPMAKYTGYGKGAIALLRKLKDINDFNFEVMPILNHVSDNIDDDDEIRTMLVDGYTNRSSGLGIVLGFPTNVDSLGSSYKVVYTMYETTDIPGSWVNHVRNANEIWVPSRFCGKVFSKYNKNIRIVPWGYDESYFNTDIPIVKNGYFTFASVGVMGYRKGVDILVEAFKSAFQHNDDVKLIIKSRDTRWLPVIDDDRITVLDVDFSDEMLANFYKTIDCLVLPTRGEGFGVPPLEAAACGTPALVTRWSGPVDYIDDNGIWGIDIEPELRKVKEMDAFHSKWCEPDKDHLIHMMQYMYNERPAVKGSYGRFNMDSMASSFVEATKKAVIASSKKPRNGGRVRNGIIVL